MSKLTDELKIDDPGSWPYWPLLPMKRQLRKCRSAWRRWQVSAEAYVLKLSEVR